MLTVSVDVANSGLVIQCPPECNFYPGKIGDKAAVELMLYRETGIGTVLFGRKVEQVVGRAIAKSSIIRHFKHYKVKVDPNEAPPDPKKKHGDLEILDLVIQRGAANSMNWKPGIKDVIEAMKLKMQMTGNSAFDDLIALFDGAEIDEDEIPAPEAPEALAAVEERELADEDPLADVAY